jgi:hypothetical protein
MSEWFKQMKIGTTGNTLSKLVSDKLPYDKFGIFLNAGHFVPVNLNIATLKLPNIADFILKR